MELVSERTAETNRISSILPTPDIAAREKALEAKEAQLKAALEFVKVGLGVLQGRALVFVSLIASVGAFAWSLVDASGWRIAAACLFTAMVFWPALWLERGD